MATKFSDFTAQAATSTTFVVGYDGSTNTQYSQTQLTDFIFGGTLGQSNTLTLGGYQINLSQGGSGNFLYMNGTSANAYFLQGRYNGQAKASLGLNTGSGRLELWHAGTTKYIDLNPKDYVNYLLADTSIGANGGTPPAKLHVKGQGNTIQTNAFLVENSVGNDIFRISDNRSIALLGASTFYNGATIDIYGVSDASAILTVNSTTKGLLPPRMTNTQRDAIGSPATGLTLYSTTNNKLQFYNGSAWQDAAGGDNIYTADGTINEDRVITVGHDATTKASYTTTFESTKTTAAGSSNTRNTALGNRLILTETVTLAPTGYSTSRGAGITLNHNSTGDDVTGTINVQSINSGTSDYYGRSQMGFRTNTGFVFSQEGTAPSNWTGDALIVRDRLASNQSKSLRYHPSQSDGGRLKLVAPNAKTSQILLASSSTDTFYRYISGNNNGALTLGRKLTSGSEEAYITCNGIGNYSGNIAVGVNQGTPAATLHVTGSGATNATTSLIVENSSGNDILNIKDDGTFALGKGADASAAADVCIGANATSTNESISIGVSSLTNAYSNQSIALGYACYANANRNINIGILARSAGANSITLATNGSTTTAGNVARQFAVHMSSSSTADFKVIANEGMVPPSITTTVRDAISSPISGSTIYNTTDNKLQFYNGSDWTDAGGGGDTIFTTSPSSVVPTGQIIKITDKIQFKQSNGAYQGWEFEIGTPNAAYAKLKVGGRELVTAYVANEAWSFGKIGTDTQATTNSFHFNTGATTMSDGWSMRVHGGNNSNGTLILKGAGATSATTSLLVEDSTGADMLSVRDDGAITIGKGATLFDEDGNGVQDVVIGYGASTDYASTYFSNQRRVAIGYNADVNAGGGIAIGHSATIGNTEGVAIGYSAQTTAYRATAVGYDASAGSYGIAVGAYSSTTGPNSVAIGGTQNATTGYGVHVGIGGSAGISSVSVGANSVSGTNATSIGKSASSTGVGAFTAGASMVNSGAYSFAFGGFAYGAAGATNTDSNSVKFYMNTTTPQLNFHLNNDSWWNSTGNFGFGITNPTDRVQTKTSIGVIGDGVNAGKLKLYCEAGSAHHVAIEGPAHTNAQGDYTIKLPNTAPSAGQVLVSDANGNLSWKSPHELDFSNLPTSDPGVEGRLYNDEGTLKVSIP